PERPAHRTREIDMTAPASPAEIADRISSAVAAGDLGAVSVLTGLLDEAVAAQQKEQRAAARRETLENLIRLGDEAGKALANLDGAVAEEADGPDTAEYLNAAVNHIFDAVQSLAQARGVLAVAQADSDRPRDEEGNWITADEVLDGHRGETVTFSPSKRTAAAIALGKAAANVGDGNGIERQHTAVGGRPYDVLIWPRWVWREALSTAWF